MRVRALLRTTVVSVIIQTTTSNGIPLRGTLGWLRQVMCTLAAAVPCWCLLAAACCHAAIGMPLRLRPGAAQLLRRLL